MAKNKQPTVADLKRKILELEGSIASSYYYAHGEVAKASTDHMMASGVVVSITALGGRQVMRPVVIRDGLSPETVAAIQRDLQRSYEQATQFKVSK